MKTQLVVSVVTLSALGLGAQGCPPSQPPVAPDSGVCGGTIIVVEPWPDVATPKATACSVPESKCCKVCTALQAHGCPEGKPTARGATCEEVCANAETGPIVLRYPDVSECTDVACIRKSTSTRRGILCEGGR